MAIRFPSDAWIKALMEDLNKSEAYAEAAKTWEGDFCFIVEPGGTLEQACDALYGPLARQVPRRVRGRRRTGQDAGLSHERAGGDLEKSPDQKARPYSGPRDRAGSSSRATWLW